jgi:hypothetical protein
VPTEIADLLALAFVRRTLLEFGFQLNPEAVAQHADIGALEVWIRGPRVDLDGETPLAMMRDEAGQARLREVLKAIVANGANFG